MAKIEPEAEHHIDGAAWRKGCGQVGVIARAGGSAHAVVRLAALELSAIAVCTAAMALPALSPTTSASA